jgi:hypothetical protein
MEGPDLVSAMGPDMCPLHTSGPIAELFLWIQGQNNTHYQTVSAGIHGDFILVPKMDMHIFDSLSLTYANSGLVVVSPPLVYWINLYRNGTLSAEKMSPTVWRVGSDEKRAYLEWLDEQKLYLE